MKTTHSKRVPTGDPDSSAELQKALDYSIVDLIDEFTAAGWDRWETLKALTKVACGHALAYQPSPPQYAWTLRARGRQDLQRVTTLDEMLDTLMMLELPGGVPPGWIMTNRWNGDIAGFGHYIHDSGSKVEWSLTWTKLDS